MSAAQTELIVQGRHRDPFSYLGPHKGQIRAWLPQAKDAAVLAGGQVIPMKRDASGGTLYCQDGRHGVPPPHHAALRRIAGNGRSVSLPSPADCVRIALARRRHQLRKLRHAGGARGHLRGRGGRSLRGVGSERRGGQRHGRSQRLGSNAPSDASARRGLWEIFLPGLAAGAHYKYSVMMPNGHEQDHSDPYGFFAEVPPKTASIVLAAHELRVGRRGVDGRSRAAELAARAGVDLRSASGILAARSVERMADVSRAGREAAGVCGRERLHASGAAARSWSIRFRDRGAIR